MSATLIQINHVSKQYSNCVAVNDLSLDVPSGIVLGLLGPRGAGKTTLVNMICGLEKPTRGEIQYFFTNDAGASKHGFIGYCPQEIIIWPQLTCYEQLIFMGRMYDIDKKTARNRAGYYLAQLGLSENRNQQAGRLNEGLKRRLNIGLSLMHDPGMVILDEPFTGLDQHTKIRIHEFIRNLAFHKTIILITHHLDVADQLCDRIAIMDHGSILLMNTPAKLKNSVGEGDVLQLSMSGDVSRIYGQLLKVLPSHVYVSFATDNKISIRAKELVDYIPKISEQVKKDKGTILNMELRSHTLDDVFIQLTGRSPGN